MCHFVRHCPNLSNASLNKVLDYCYNASSFVGSSNADRGQYMTFAYIGLSEDQVNICKTLSNYNKAINAGWTTGY